MRLSKKQEQATTIAVNVMDTIISNGQDDGSSGELDFVIDELLKMRNNSMALKLKNAKKRR